MAEQSRGTRISRLAGMMLLDSIIAFLAYTVVFFVRAYNLPLSYLESLWFVLFASVFVVLVLYLFGVYHRVWRRTSGHEVTVVINAVVINTAIVMIVDHLVATPRPLPFSVALVGNLLALMGFVAVRYRSRVASSLSWRWRAVWKREFPDKPTRVLLVGAGEAGQTFAWQLKHRWPAQLGSEKYRIVGFVDDDPGKQGLIVEGCRVLGTRADIPLLVADEQVDLIILTIHNISGPDFREVLAYCQSTPARIKVLPDTLAMMQTANTPLLRDVQAEDILGRKPIGKHEAVDFAPVNGKVILVTGAAGSIGSELCRQLLTYAPTRLIALDNNESGLYDLLTELRLQESPVEIIPALVDVTNREAVETLFAVFAPQVVFHAAAYKHVPMLEFYPHEAVRVNIGGTWNVAELALLHRAERFVLISTDKAVNPTSVMGASKRACELLVHALAQQKGEAPTLLTAVRFGNVLGSRGSVVPKFNTQIDAGGPVTVTHKDVTRYFMTIAEAVNLVIHAACLTEDDDLFMLKMGEVVKIAELAERMIRLRGLRPYQDIDIKFVGLRPGEKLHEALNHASEQMISTVHPNIVKLNDQIDLFYAHHYLDALRGLLQSCAAQPASFAQRLLQPEADDETPRQCFDGILTAIHTAYHDSTNGTAARAQERGSVAP